ncbi:Fe-S cluster assembly protein SufB [Prevotella sp. A2931]|uniref:Fe-S cluster assembly protein SufB n=1 Tax=Prevotella illustrans TaxID=2800387 RepID=A0ABS3M264_9BACT|nr:MULTISPECIES: Fe-S cluster assembly protein SufB [Prevotella]MBO1362272.1 Fe-S cluster assembly protein SufB [Prevotella illustrans]PTL26473.1 Fe-S cluster assembly protein SufB [Prevotella sp. oral taxon 820]
MEEKNEKNAYVKQVAEQKYEFGFTTDVHTEIIEKGLNEDVVRLISQKKGEPGWMLDFRLQAFNHWKTLKQPSWGHVHLPEIDYQAISYYADPLAKKPVNKEIDPELEKTFDKLGIPLEERLALSGTAVDAIMDSVSVKTTFKEKLREKGVIFCSIGEAIKEQPDLVRQYLGSVVPYRDNFFAALNSAVFSDGSFVYIPKGVRCPMELSSYFRINARNTGQFERTLIIADDDAYVSYLEGCTAPMRDENQLHAAIVEIIVNDRAEVKYSTVQNWYPGDENGKGGVFNLVTKRGDLRGVGSKLSWTQVETGSAITWKYPSCILRGDNSVAEFYSVAVTNHYQEADTGTKMIHMGRNTKSTIISKGISAGHSQNSYRGLVRATANADNARNYSSCDSLLLSSECGAHTFPYMDIHNESAVIEHEATTSKISEDQLFYCNQRGIPTEQAVGLIVNGYAKEVLNKLPMEFAVEAQKLLNVSLEGTVG